MIQVSNKFNSKGGKHRVRPRLMGISHRWGAKFWAPNFHSSKSEVFAAASSVGVQGSFQTKGLATQEMVVCSSAAPKYCIGVRDGLRSFPLLRSPCIFANFGGDPLPFRKARPGSRYLYNALFARLRARCKSNFHLFLEHPEHWEGRGEYRHTPQQVGGLSLLGPGHRI